MCVAVCVHTYICIISSLCDPCQANIYTVVENAEDFALVLAKRDGGDPLVKGNIGESTFPF